LASIIAGAIFAAVDEAMTAFGEARVRAAREHGEGADSKTAARYLNRTDEIELRLMTGRILAAVCAAVISYDLALQYGAFYQRVLVVGGTALGYAGLVGAATTFASRRARRLALPLLRFARPLELLVAPLAAPLVWSSALIERFFPPSPEDDPERITGVVVEHIIEQGEEAGSIDEEDAELLKSVLEFRETVAREVMVPRTSMVALEVGMPLSEVMALIVKQGHSRYPVYRENIDRPIGVFYAKDLFRLAQNGGGFEGSLADLTRAPVFFTAESQRISELLRQMQARRVHLAIVVDEYGGTSGMVTLEDIIEEIVGEIEDEHDFREEPVQEIGPGRFIANADVSVHDLAAITGLKLPEGANGYESLGGMLVDLAGKVPTSGEEIEIGDHALIVRAADERHVTRVEVVARESGLPPAAE
jgi:CBS domain containing-hemolysin-like protein